MRKQILSALILLFLAAPAAFAQESEAAGKPRQHRCVMAISQGLVFWGYGRTIEQAKHNAKWSCWNKLTAKGWSWNAKVVGCTYAYERNMACK